MSDIAPILEVPSELSSRLRAVRRRNAWMGLSEGTLLTCTVLVVGMTLALAFDWLVVLFESQGRVLLTAAALVPPIAAFVWFCAVPMLTPRRLSDLALQVDEAVPALQERWTTVTQLAETHDPPAVRGADGLIRQVRFEATRMSELVVASHVITPQLVRRRGLELLVAALPLLVMLGIAPGTTATLLARFWLPTRAITLTQVTAPAGNCVVPRGENVELRAQLTGRIPAHAALQMRRGGATESLSLLPSGDKSPSQNPEIRPAGSRSHTGFGISSKPSALAHTIATIQEPFDYRFRAGDGQTPWYHVAIEDRPSIAGIVFRITPPAYSKLPVDSRDNLPNRCRVLKGSRLELAFQASKPLASLALELADKQSWPLVMTAGQWYRLDRTLDESVAFTVRLLDRHGLENLAAPTCRITVYEDDPPQVRITSPAEEISLRPDDRIQVEFKARDDLGIAKAELVVSTEENGKEKILSTTDIPLGSKVGAKNVEGKAPLDLKRFDLKQGQVLNYAVRVHDTRAAAAQSSSGIRSDEAASQPAGQSSSSQPASEQAGNPSASQPEGLASTAPAGTNQPPSSQAANNRQSDQQQKNAPADSKASASPKQSSGSQAQASGQPKPSQCAGGGQSQPKQQQPSDQKPQSPKDAKPQTGKQTASSAPVKLADKREPSTSPAGSCNAGGKQPRIGENDRKDQKPSEKKGGCTPPPPNDMTKRWLPGPGCQCSSKQRIKVDEWAGSFEGQAREKIEIAVDQYLNRLKKDLADAEKPVLELRAEVKPETKWDEPKGAKLRTARDLLGDAEKTTTELRSVSRDTPYAAIGLQLDEIVQSHVVPARSELGDVALFPADPARQQSDLDQAALHIAEARRMLGEIVKQYEEAKRQQKAEETTKELAKVHQLFIEDMQKLLKLMQNRPSLNPRSPEFVEVTDEFLKKLKEHLEKIKSLRDELAKALANDPDLLRRMMARTRLEGATLRDQLTMLALRQQLIAKNVGAWSEAGPGGTEALRRALQSQYARRQAELAEATLKLYENVETWIPRGLDREEGALLDSRRLASKLALSAKDLNATIASGNMDRALQQGEPFLRDLRLLQERIMDTGVDNPNHEKLALFIANRMEETGRLRLQQSNLIKQIKESQEGHFGREAAIPQHELVDDTVTLGGKLDGAAGMLGSLSPQIGEKGRTLAEMVRATIPADQKAAVDLLLKPEARPARDAENRLVVRFEQAEKLFDELLTDVEKAIVAQGPPTDVPPEKTLEELLAGLENECKACEKLGAAVALNVQVNDDWMGGEGSGNGTGSGSGTGSGQGQSPSGQGQKGQAQSKQDKPGQGKGDQSGSENDKLAKALAEAAEAMAKEHGASLQSVADGIQAAGTGKPPTAGSGGRDWNILVSKLQEELRQSRDHVPPEQYQQAIDAYFKSIADMVGAEQTTK